MGTGSLLKTANHRRGLLTLFPTTPAHEGNIFRGNQINLNPILNALRTRLSMVKMFSIDWGRDSQGSEPFVDVAQQPASFHKPPHVTRAEESGCGIPGYFLYGWPAPGTVLELPVTF